MAKKVLLVVVIAVAAFLAFVATRPATYHVARTVSVAAPQEVVFTEMNSLENFVRWSPWEKKDPNMKRSFSGAKAGAGAQYAWEGNGEVGQGEMTIDDAKAPDQVFETVRFIKPFASTAKVTMTAAKDGDKTTATWAMDGEQTFGGKLMSVFTSMDKLIGPDFDEGLNNLAKVAAEDAKTLDAAKKAAADAGTKAAAVPPPAEGTPPPSPAGIAPPMPTAPAKG